MAHKHNLSYAMIFEKKELDHRGRQFLLNLQFCTDNIIASTIFYPLKIQNVTLSIVSLISTRKNLAIEPTLY